MLKSGLVLVLAALLGFSGGCAPVQTAPEQQGFDWTLIIFLVLIVGVFYFLMIRPQRKRQKDHMQLMQGLQRGARVVTAGGIYGEIESLSEDSVVLKVESGAMLRVARGSIVGMRQK